MIQNVIKILTLGFFISMITGFVMYRSGYFDSTETSYSLQKSPNGGELNANLAQVDQDTNKIPQINQNNAAPIMPSSKSAVPILDLEEAIQDDKKRILPSSKSMLHPIEISPETQRKMMSSSKSIIISDPSVSSKSNREAIKIQPELEPKDSSIADIDESEESESTGENIKEKKGKVEPDNKSTPINWRGIWIGVLGILFVAIGSIVYFKRRSK
ncbi:MAG: hypothetical protein P8P74_07045 [Crocinitomicaceae bacterium]|nr:hypothetical protein [Crocinitomicaceae bacterium]